VANEVTLTPKGERWRRTRHPWVYRDDLKEVGESLAGQVVRVKAPDGTPVGQAFCNPRSKITLRWLTDDPEQPVDRGFWAGRLQAAMELRRRVVKDSDAYRLIHSEADGFPGLIVDRYGEVLVVQSLGLGIEQALPTLLDLLGEMLSPKAVVARNDSLVRKLEGLAVEKKLLSGNLPERIEVTEGERRYRVDVMEGHKTGAYLDQRENRLWARGFARGRVLDVFAYQGGFALQMAGAAREVLAIEDSAAALGRLKENLELNGITNVRAERGNAFDRLRELEKSGERFDLVILDPPAFAKNRGEIRDAWRGYREINLRALRILNPTGTLITCSCSHLVSEEIFAEILREAAADSQRTARFIESRTQSRDHPVLLTHPESKYLKCVALEAA
jgi:23S rRNA (cytosine1962-C5)-methyltransferase